MQVVWSGQREVANRNQHRGLRVFNKQIYGLYFGHRCSSLPVCRYYPFAGYVYLLSILFVITLVQNLLLKVKKIKCHTLQHERVKYLNLNLALTLNMYKYIYFT